MSKVSLKDKQAYFAKMQRANYEASMRLEGIDTTLASPPKNDKAAVLEKYRQRQP
nr:YhfG family protein [uncultured Halomonas sp.]